MDQQRAGVTAFEQALRERIRQARETVARAGQDDDQWLLEVATGDLHELLHLADANDVVLPAELGGEPALVATPA